MKKTVWIWNHYATSMFFDKGGRHHWFGKFLLRKGYDVKIFCASTVHNSTEEVDTQGRPYITDSVEGVEYVFVKVPAYAGNGRARIANMIAFYKGVQKAAFAVLKSEEKPMVIIASSVHPLTLIAGEKVAKKFEIPCICEVRDLWPETLVELGAMKRNSFIAKILYSGEKRIYKKADKLIFTMPGGKDYIRDQKLDKVVNLKDVYTINNGIDLENFNWQRDNEIYQDADLDGDGFKVLYTGAVRMVNQVEKLVRAARVCKEKNCNHIKFIIIGDGDEKQKLIEYASRHNLDNVIFKDRVLKKYIPNILSKGDLNAVTVKDTDIGKYGVSWNKLFEYMASGRPVIVNYNMNYNLVEEYDIGTCRCFESDEAFADEIIRISRMPEGEYRRLSDNAIAAARNFDYEVLTNRLEDIIFEAIEN